MIMGKDKNKVEVSFSNDAFKHFETGNSIAVVVDVLRATSAIITAFMNGVNTIIPVGTLEEAREYKNKGYMVAAERDGVVRDFADFGNSPFNFKKEVVEGQDIAYSTTNGTMAVQQAAKCKAVVIGAHLNVSALADWLIDQHQDVIIACAGWKNKFSLEDTVFAGSLAQKLTGSGHFNTICDSALAAIDLYNIAKNDMIAYIDKAANRHRLKRLGLDDVIGYCHTPDVTKIIPVLEQHYLVKFEHERELNK